MNEITQKQKEVIEIIESNTRHVFKGKTRQDAIDFISAHIEESKIRTRDFKANRAIEEAMFFNNPAKNKPKQTEPQFVEFTHGTGTGFSLADVTSQTKY